MSKSSHSGSGSEVARLATALSGARSLTRADTAKALARLTTGARAERDGLRFEIRVDGVCADIIEMIARTDTTALTTVTIRVRQKRLVPIMHPSQRRKRQLVVLKKRGDSSRHVWFCKRNFLLLISRSRYVVRATSHH